MTNAMQNLPPELQARLAAVMAGKQQNDPSLQAAAAAAAQMQQAQAPELQMQQGAPPVPMQMPNQAAVAPTPPAAPPKPPSLVDLLLMVRSDIDALRQEVATLNAQVSAASQVNEAVGHAVGRMYQMFQPSEQTAPAATYSQGFQAQAVDDDSDY